MEEKKRLVYEIDSQHFLGDMHPWTTDSKTANLEYGRDDEKIFGYRREDFGVNEQTLTPLFENFWRLP
jgi:hypothetical protein